jgi:hypothetical protein
MEKDIAKKKGRVNRAAEEAVGEAANDYAAERDVPSLHDAEGLVHARDSVGDTVGDTGRSASYVSPHQGVIDDVMFLLVFLSNG